MLLNRIETNTAGLISQSALEIFRVVPPGEHGSPRGHCEACGDAIWSAGGYRMPQLAGLYCGMFCIEAKLFSLNHCRWCGWKMGGPYTSVDSRLCSSDCSENYYAHVLGSRTAALGTGRRLLVWLQSNQPETYRRLLGAVMPEGSFCRNVNCMRGENGHPASLEHLRKGSRFCSEECRGRARRNGRAKEVLTGIFDPSPTPVLCGFSRGNLGQMG